MRKTVYTKFIFAYLLFALFGFLVVATFSSRAINDLVTKTEADKLYKEAIIIADTYAKDLYGSETSLESVKKQFDILALYFLSFFLQILPSTSKIPYMWRISIPPTISEAFIKSAIFTECLKRTY